MDPLILDGRQQLTSNEPSQMLKLSLGCVGSSLFRGCPGLSLLNTISRQLEVPMNPFNERSRTRM